MTRPELFTRSEHRLRVRAHDLRATFVTLALAAGKSESWVADRTGHKSSAMINKYRRTARFASELGLGELAPLDQAVPELRGDGAAEEGSGGTGDDPEDGDEVSPTVSGDATDSPPQSRGAETLGHSEDLRSAQGRNRTADTGIFNPLFHPSLPRR